MGMDEDDDCLGRIFPSWDIEGSFQLTRYLWKFYHPHFQDWAECFFLLFPKISRLLDKLDPVQKQKHVLYYKIIFFLLFH